MEIVTGPLEWSHQDEQRWAEFLESDTGKRLIPRLMESAPTLLDSGETNAILIRTGEMRGLQHAVSTLLLMAHPPAPVERVETAYPLPEDDSKWPDGMKLTKE